MGEWADEEINGNLLCEGLSSRRPIWSRQPIWVDQLGVEYWKWRDITNTHLTNIIKFLGKRGIDIPRKFTLEARKRGLVGGF